MKKEFNYVECNGCKWTLENDKFFDFVKFPCTTCNNTKLVIDPLEILCNLCGETMCPIGHMNEQYPHGLYNAKVSGGYDSYHLLDMTTYQFSFCEKCLRNLFIQSKIKPLILNYDSEASDYAWENDQKYYEYRVWKDSGGHHQAYLNKKCNQIKNCPNKAEYSAFFSDEFSEEAICEEHKNNLNNIINAKLRKFICNELKSFL